ncbi:MAG: T9SS type A sorting domain-containing protein [Bacteroidia bacterium]|nr:T9SS type A sorting domain-containing protein [Bacteroidia bacterium]
MKKLIAILFFFGLNQSLLNAQTGSFNVNLNFNGSSRMLSFFVPTDYDSTAKYQLMLCLHGAGDNSNNYRNALINSYKWTNVFANTIFCVPDGGSDPNRDFYQPSGDEDFIDDALLYSQSHFSIDDTKILLQGFSLGGRSALKFGLDNPTIFKGLLLNTPALQGLLDLENYPKVSLMYDFEKAAQIPIFISAGDQDYAYFPILQKLSIQLKSLNAPVFFQSIPGMGHAIAVSSRIAKAVPFFETGFVAHQDLDLFEVKVLSKLCSSSFPVTFYVRNNGDSIVKEISTWLTIGSDQQQKTSTVNLLPNHFAMVTMDFNSNLKGLQNLSAQVNSNFSNAEIDVNNNQLVQEIEILSPDSKANIKEDFEEDTKWKIQHSGSLFEWYLDPEVKRNGNTSLASFNTILYFYTANSVESVLSPFINIKALSNKSLSFDLAFNYMKYTPPYVSETTNFADTLEIQISNDCGSTFTTLFKKGGKELATTPEPILNPINIGDMSFLPTNDEWRRVIIDLSNYSQIENALFKFNCISGMGGLLNIDNLGFGSDILAIEKQRKILDNLRVFPNPASDYIEIDLKEMEQVSVEFINQNGLVVKQEKVNNNSPRILVSDLTDGLYILKICSSKNVSFSKILIAH